jgi:hypothetical protein
MMLESLRDRDDAVHARGQCGCVSSVQSRTCVSLSIDHNLNRPRKLWPSSKELLAGATLPMTFCKTLAPHFEQRIVNCCEGRSNLVQR